MGTQGIPSHSGDLFLFTKSIFPFWLLHFFGSDGKELLAIYLAIVAVVAAVSPRPSVLPFLFHRSLTESLTDLVIVGGGLQP